MAFKTEYKHLIFWNVRVDWSTEKVSYTCSNKSGEDLGEVRWYEPWKQYCFYDNVNGIYSEGCLKDIAAFISQLPKEK